MSKTEDHSGGKLSLMQAVSIGIGGMVGGGIFAVLGLAVSLSSGATPFAFLFAGVIALLTSYSYAKLSLAFPDHGGTVKFMNVGFGVGVFSGGLNNLLWFSYIVMLSLYATAFGSYAVTLINVTGNHAIDEHIFITSVVVLAAAVNYYSVSFVGKIESIAVAVKLIILTGFVFVGAYGLVGNSNLNQLQISNWPDTIYIFSGGMVIFVAYEGFELIANASPDIVNPTSNIPKAYGYSVLFVVFLYFAISTITVGSLSFAQISEAKDYALAQAASPVLGKIGFTTITIAALISTFSAINASLYGGSRVSYELAEDDEVPHELTKRLWNQPIGLAITTIFTLVIANTLNLESISTAGSSGFLLIFAMVNLVSFKMSEKIKSKKIVTLIAFILCLVAFVVLIVQQLFSNILGASVALTLIAGSFLLEAFYKKSEKKNA